MTISLMNGSAMGPNPGSRGISRDFPKVAGYHESRVASSFWRSLILDASRYTVMCVNIYVRVPYFNRIKRLQFLILYKLKLLTSVSQIEKIYVQTKDKRDVNIMSSYKYIDLDLKEI